MVMLLPRRQHPRERREKAENNTNNDTTNLFSDSYYYHWQRPLGAAHGVMRLTQVRVVAGSSLTTRSGAWARPWSIDQLEREIATVSSCPITTLQVVFQTCFNYSPSSSSSSSSSSSKTAVLLMDAKNPEDAGANEESSTTDATVSSSWIRVCRALQDTHRHGSIPAVHFLGNDTIMDHRNHRSTKPPQPMQSKEIVAFDEDAHRAVLLQHLLRQTTMTMPAVHVCHAQQGCRRTLEVLADAMTRPPAMKSQIQQSPIHPSGTTTTTTTTTTSITPVVAVVRLRELVLRNCRALADADEGESLRRMVPHLERWKLLDGTTILDENDVDASYRWWQWTEQHCPHTAIAWQVTTTPWRWWRHGHEQSASCSTTASTGTSSSYLPNDTVEDTNKSATLVASHPKTTATIKQQQQQQQQQLWQDYLDWNCSLNEWRWHWLKPFRLGRQRAHQNHHHHHHHELVEAVCVVLQAWYRTHHRPHILATNIYDSARDTSQPWPQLQQRQQHIRTGPKIER